MSFQTVILAGGRGARLRPLTDHLPKPLVPVNGKPYLVWQIEDLVRQGLSRILILTGYRGEQIETAIGDGEKWEAKITYSHESEPLGTAGALIQAENLLDPAFLLLNGDSFLSLNFKLMMDVFVEKSVPMLVATYDNRDDTSVPNNLKMDRDHISDYRKGAGRAEGFEAVDAGVYILSRAVIEVLKRNRPVGGSKIQNLESLWTDLMAQKKIGAYPVDRRFYDIGTLDRLKEFENALNQMDRANGGLA